MKKIVLVLTLILLFADNSYADNYTLNFDGINDYVSVPDSDDWAFGTGDFTLEFWVKLNTVKTTAFFGPKPASVREELHDIPEFPSFPLTCVTRWVKSDSF